MANGLEGAAAEVIAMLAANLPMRIEVLRGLRGDVLDEAGNAYDPTPAQLFPSQLPYDAVNAEDWPFLQAVPLRTPRRARKEVDHTTGDTLYDATHELAVFTWVRGEGFRLVSALQRRLTEAAADTLLAYQQISETTKLLEDTLDVNLSDVGVDSRLGATVAAGRISFSVRAEERLVNPRAPYWMNGQPPAVGLGPMDHPALGVTPKASSVRHPAL